jgi:hypothetical protein
MKTIHRKRTKTRRLLLGFLFILGSPNSLTLLIGLPMVVVGQLINLLTYGILTKRDSLVTTGPYAWCRNPFYVGTFLTDFGFCVACDPTKPLTLAITLLYALVQGTFYYQQMFKEESLLSQMHGSQYDEYRRSVRWRLLPSPIAAARNGGFSLDWSAGLALHNRIFSRSLSAGFWMLAFWALSIGTQDGQSYLLTFDRTINFVPAFTNPWLMLTTAVILGAYLLFRVLEWRKRNMEVKTEGAEDRDAAMEIGENAGDLNKISEAKT